MCSGEVAVCRAGGAAGIGFGQLGFGLVRAQRGVVDLAGEFGGVGGIDQGEVVDAGRRPGRLRRDLRPGLGVGVTGDLERQRRARVGPVEADAQEGQVERVEDELDLPPGQPGVDLVTVAVQRDEGGFGDGAVLGPAERLGQSAGAGTG